jgi:hypothetical protein
MPFARTQSRLRSKFERLFPATNMRYAKESASARVASSPRGALGPVWISVGSLALLTPMQNDFPAALSLPAYASFVRIAAQRARHARAALSRCSGCAASSPTFAAPSGHLYFTLKDGGAQVDCVMFRSRPRRSTGSRARQQVEARALPTLYEPRGPLPAHGRGHAPAGLGPLYERFLRLKERLGARACSTRRKRALPPFPAASAW